LTSTTKDKEIFFKGTASKRLATKLGRFTKERKLSCIAKRTRLRQVDVKNREMALREFSTLS
jgi:hypothetical protein